MFRLHATLAPHVGAISAVAMVVCGGLFYWLALGRAGGTFDAKQLLEFNNGWSQESSAQPPPAADGVAAPADSELSSPPLELAPPQRVADAAAADAGSVESTEAPAENPPAAMDEPVLEFPATAPASAMESPEPLPPTAVTLNHPITPTPELNPYPTTPIPLNALDALATGVTLPAAAVAERPTDQPAVASPH